MSVQPLADLCSRCSSRWLDAVDERGNVAIGILGKVRCFCTVSPAAGDLVFRDDEGIERRQRSGPVRPPPGYRPPFVLTWTAIRCTACGLWKGRDDSDTLRRIWAPEEPPSMAPSDLCVCS